MNISDKPLKRVVLPEIPNNDSLTNNALKQMFALYNTSLMYRSIIMSSTWQNQKNGETREIILQYINNMYLKVIPIIREICAAVGLKSTSTVHGS